MNDLMLKLSGIRCVGANGQEFEEYSHIGVSMEREIDPSQKSFDNHLMNLFKGIKIVEKKGLVIPSLPLTLNMLVELSQSEDTESRRLLQQYNNLSTKNPTSFWTNTVVVINEQREMRIIHYPAATDLLGWDVNTGRKLDTSKEYNQSTQHIVIEQSMEGLEAGFSKRVSSPVLG